MNAYPLFFQPVFQHRIWGGTQLQRWYESCPQQDQIGEAWILADHADGTSLITNGRYSGHSLSALMSAEPAWFNGLKAPFPLLFKVIDAAADLSVQVHPDDAYGLAHAGEQGKTECWWVLAADDDARIIYGHTAETRDALKKAVAEDAWDTLLQVYPTKERDFWFVPAGKLHALGAGTMVLEVQQNSNTTYRVYDYHRKDADGNERTLHLDDALNVTTVPDAGLPDASPRSAADDRQRLADCPYFRVELWKGTDLSTRDVAQVQAAAVVSGEGILRDSDSGIETVMKRGAITLLPVGAQVTFDGDAELVVTTVPTPSRSAR